MKKMRLRSREVLAEGVVVGEVMRLRSRGVVAEGMLVCTLTCHLYRGLLLRLTFFRSSSRQTIVLISGSDYEL